MMTLRTLKSSLAALAVLALAACVSALAEQKLPDITFTHLPKLAVQVTSIDIVEDWQAPLAAPHVDHLAPVRPLAVMRRWADDRLAAAGTEGVARFVIENASLVEQRLATDQGVSGLFKKEQSDRYTITLTGKLEIDRSDLKGTGFANASVELSRTVVEDITLAEREKVWFELTEAAMVQFNTLMEENAAIYLDGLVTRQPE